MCDFLNTFDIGNTPFYYEFFIDHWFGRCLRVDQLGNQYLLCIVQVESRDSVSVVRLPLLESP